MNEIEERLSQEGKNCQTCFSDISGFLRELYTPVEEFDQIMTLQIYKRETMEWSCTVRVRLPTHILPIHRAKEKRWKSIRSANTEEKSVIPYEIDRYYPVL